jgi:hypothetical protein
MARAPGSRLGSYEILANANSFRPRSDGNVLQVLALSIVQHWQQQFMRR